MTKTYENFLFGECTKEEKQLECDMQELPWQKRKDQYMLYEQLLKTIKEQLKKQNPSVYKSTSRTQIDLIAKQLSEVVNPTYKVLLMEYEALNNAFKIQGNYLIKMGEISIKSYFALIDDSAKIVGIHIPKTAQQRFTERMINTALNRLDSFLETKGKEPEKELRGILKNFLWEQKYPKNPKPLKIYAENHSLSGEGVIEKSYKHEKKLQLKFDSKKNILHYHIAR